MMPAARYIGAVSVARRYRGSTLIWPTADAPVASDDTATLTEGQAINIRVLANDTGSNLTITDRGLPTRHR